MSLYKLVSVLLLCQILLGLIAESLMLHKTEIGEASAPDLDLYESLKENLSLPSNAKVSGGGSQPIIETSSCTLIFVNQTHGDVYRSVDGGKTWNEVLDAGYTNDPAVNGVLLTSSDWIILPISKAGDSVYVSKDDGVTWSLADTDFLPLPFNFVQLSNGTIFVATWGYTSHVYKSDDAINWSLQWNVTSILEEMGYSDTTGTGHIHCLVYDSYISRWYVAAGDDWTGTGVSGKTTIYSDDDGSSWRIIPNHGGPISYWTSEAHGTFFGPDHNYHDVWYFDSSGIAHDLDLCRRNNFRPYSHGFLEVNNVVYLEMTAHISSWDYGIMVSPDEGKTWGKLYTVERTRGGIYPYKGQNDRIYICDDANEKIYKFRALTLREAKWLCRKDKVSVSGGALTYQLEIGTGTDWIDFGSHIVSDATLRFKGHSYKNNLLNPSFETGDTTGWIISGATVTDTEARNGTYSAMWDAPTRTESYQQDYVWVGNGATVINSVYAKANVEVSAKFRVCIGYRNSTNKKNKGQHYTTFDLTRSWQRCVETRTIPAWANEAKIMGYVLANDLRIYIDSCQMEVSHENHPDKHFNIYEPAEYFEGTLNTTNPTVTIAGQRFYYSGELANNAESPIQSLPAAVEVGSVTMSSCSVDGSELATLAITATVTETVTGYALLDGRTHTVYCGHCYGSFTIPSTSKVILFAENRTTVAISSYSNDILVFSVSGDSGYTSTTQVCCGDRGEPMAILAVNGTLTWSHNAFTTMSTLNVTHESPTKILIYWKFPGDVNDDGFVEIQDLARIGKAYRATPDDPKWDRGCDVNGDEIIDTYDVAITGEYYGRSR